MKKVGIIMGVTGLIIVIVAFALWIGFPSPSIPKSPSAIFEPITITGTSDMTSAPFEVTTNEWIVDWSYVPDPEYDGVFAFYVYPRGEREVFVEAIIADSNTFGTTYSYVGKGEYYIKVICLFIQSWEITIRPA